MDGLKAIPPVGQTESIGRCWTEKRRGGRGIVKFITQCNISFLRVFPLIAKTYVFDSNLFVHFDLALSGNVAEFDIEIFW